MKNDIFTGIVYKELSENEKAYFQTKMAKATLAIESLASVPDMVWENRDLYRKLIIGCKVLGLTSHEIAVCKNINDDEKNAILEVEKFKMRLLEGYVKFLAKYVSQKMATVKYFTEESSHHHIRRDLNGESQVAFCHAVYRFNRYDIQFITFLGTVVKNWLNNYCQQLSRIKLGEKLKDDLIEYNLIRAKELKAGRVATFEEIIRIIVLNEIRDQAIAATEKNIEEHIENNHERFLELRQISNRVLQIKKDDMVSMPTDVFTEVIVNDVMSRMNERQRKLVEHKINGGGLQKFATLHNMNKKEVELEFRAIQELIGSSLMA